MRTEDGQTTAAGGLTPIGWGCAPIYSLLGGFRSALSAQFIVRRIFISGYYGFSMSNNAMECYRDNIKPLSAWSKGNILDAIDQAVKEGEIELSAPISDIKRLSAKELKSFCLVWDSWHHTSSHYNKTDFYKLDIDGVERLTVDFIEEVISARKPKAAPTEKKAFCEFLEWSGTRRHPKATVCQAWGTIKGNWFYLANGKKKSISANGFKVLETK